MIVTAAVILRNGKVLIGRKEDRWEFPGGKLKEGEAIEDCLKREIKEEMEAEIDVGEEIGVERDGDIEVHFFRATLNGDYYAKEHDEMRWVDIHELKNYRFFNADRKFIERLLEKNEEYEN